MSAWQMQCCGEPFGVGSRVRWTLASVGEYRDFLGAFMGDELAGTVAHREEHHGGAPVGTPATEGVVASIRAVWCRFGSDSDRPHDLNPDAGSATVLPMESADGWNPDEGESRFVGYIVELDAG
jgi:hypothetical protein